MDLESTFPLGETAQETTESTKAVGSEPKSGDNSEVSDTVFKRYAHHGKRRRSYTEELFRCQLTDMISRSPLVCNHLLWKNKPDELRDHLSEHMKVEDVAKLSDSEVSARYADAKRIFLAGIPEDCDDEEEEESSE